MTDEETKRPVMERHDLECRFCNTRWSMFIKNNSRCTSSSCDGVHNFDFRKLAETDSQEKQSSNSRSTGRAQFSMKVLPDA